MESDLVKYQTVTCNENDFKTTDWWETAFKPTFSLKQCREILDISYDASSDSLLTLPSDEIVNFKSVKQVSTNIDNDPNIYRKVWREQRFMTNEFPKLKSCLSESYLSNILKSEEKTNCCNKFTQTKECIWNAKEIKIIRSCIKDFKRKDIILRTEVKELTNRNEDLNTKVKHLEQRLEKKTNTLNEVLKANDRFHILSETLSKQLDDAKERNSIIINQKTDLLDQLNHTNLSMELLKKQVIEKDSEINRLKKVLDGIGMKSKRQMDNCIEKLKEKHRLEMDSLQGQVNNISKDLFKEKTMHQATNTGFQQLLKHFSEKSAKMTCQPDVIDIKSIKYTNM